MREKEYFVSWASETRVFGTYKGAYEQIKRVVESGFPAEDIFLIYGTEIDFDEPETHDFSKAKYPEIPSVKTLIREQKQAKQTSK